MDELGRSNSCGERMPQVEYTPAAGTSQSLEPSQHMAVGYSLVQAGKHVEAIPEFSLALEADLTKQQEHDALVERASALTEFCRTVREKPAAHSEVQALYGLDPMHLAQLALKDAQRAFAAVPGSAPALLQQGRAHVLLEQYSQAQQVFLEGMAGKLGLSDPVQAQLQQALRQVSSFAAASRGPVERSEDLDCILCLKLLYEPVTTPCGHTFCRPCFLRASDHSSKCPLCRTLLHVGRELPVTVTLKAVLQSSFPQEYAQRQEEERQHLVADGGAGAQAPVPLFVMSCLLPGERMAINIFEPRYRLMVRRCMEGNRCFGMASVSHGHTLCDVACNAEIVTCQPLPDGRFHLEILGRQRFKILRSWEQDGYRVVQPEPVADEAVAPNSAETAELRRLTSEVTRLAEQWVERIRTMAAHGSYGARFMELLARAGPQIEPAADGWSHSPDLSFWVATLLPLTLSQRLEFSSMTSTSARLQAELEIMRHSEGASGCRLM